MMHEVTMKKIYVLLLALLCACEQSRKLRISVTKIENGPDRFF